MYTSGSQECLKNAEHIFEDAKILFQNKSYGTAQSLMVTSIEEAAKALILELANLNYIGKNVLKNSMHFHPPKQVVLLAIEKGLLFLSQIDCRETGFPAPINNIKIDKLRKKISQDFSDLENKRENGFYVRVSNNGRSIKSPTNIQDIEVQIFLYRIGSLFKTVKSLCKFFAEYRNNPEGTTRNRLIVEQDKYGNYIMSYDEA